MLDAILARDKRARVACETLVKTGVAIVAGEVSTQAWVDLEELVRRVIQDIGYTSSQVGFDGAKIQENVQALIDDLKKAKPASAKGVYLKKITLSTTMGPGLSIDKASLDI